MIDKLLLHDQTKQALQTAITSRSHALVLVGLAGSGKGTLARVLAASYLAKSTVGALLAEPYFREVGVNGATIGIETIRDLQKFVSLKTTGTTQIRRVLLVEDAQNMTTEAQNAFLKLLEEPPADTALILTVDHQQHLLPTVNSRLQILQVLPPAKNEVTSYFSPAHTAKDIERAYLLSEGRLGLLHALLSNDSEHPLAVQIERAKQIYGQKTFERLCMVEELSKQKDSLPELLAALKRIAKTAMEQSAIKDLKPATQQWHRRLDAIHSAESALAKSANPKLLLTDLFLSL